MWRVLLLLFVAAECQRVYGQAGPEQGLRFSEVVESGIDWEHSTGRSKRGYIVEGIASGLSTFDYDRDGFVDVYLLNGNVLSGPKPEKPLIDGFFRNLGDLKFRDVMARSGIDGTGYGLGVCAADFDADGFSDLYINNYGKNYLFQNCGDGTFQDVTERAGVANGEKVGGGVAFADFDSDGDLDLYVGNYVDFTLENSVYIERNGQVFHAGPRYYKSVPDTLFQNNGDGTFSDVSKSSGIGLVAGPTMGLIAADLNQDGAVDVFTCNDAKPNFFFVNDGTGHFTEDGVISGLAFDFRGTANASMGVDIGDFDRDGLQDLISTNYQNELPVLYKNLGDGQFQDFSTNARITEALQPHVTWGCTFADFNNDGQLDIYIGCGHFDDAEITDDRTAKKVRDFVLIGEKGHFRDVSEQVGMTVVESTRGVAFEDLDNDGDIDVLALNSNAKPSLLRNDLNVPSNRWVEIELIDPSSSNRQAVNSKLKLTAGDLAWYVETVCGRGYQSSYQDRVHVAIGNTDQPLKLEVIWPDKSKEVFSLETSKLNYIIHGQGGSLEKR